MSSSDPDFPLCPVVSDPNVDVIYVASRPLGKDIASYYSRLLERQAPGAPEIPSGPSSFGNHKRFTIITPEALDYFPVSFMCMDASRLHHQLCFTII